MGFPPSAPGSDTTGSGTHPHASVREVPSQTHEPALLPLETDAGTADRPDGRVLPGPPALAISAAGCRVLY